MFPPTTTDVLDEHCYEINQIKQKSIVSQLSCLQNIYLVQSTVIMTDVNVICSCI